MKIKSQYFNTGFFLSIFLSLTVVSSVSAVTIGTDTTDDVERIRLESNLPNWLRLTTYDELIERVRHWRNLILSA